MAFTVEDGTGVAGANAYIDLDYANAYHAERGNSGWTGVDEVRQQAIVRATDYVETRWGTQFRGAPEFWETPQGLSFPRLYIYDHLGTAIEGVPDLLKRAIAEYALRALNAALMPDPSRPESGVSGPVTSVRERVGPIESETRYAFGVVTPEMVSYPAADRLVRQLIARNGGVYR
jgi:hypothetical protein